MPDYTQLSCASLLLGKARCLEGVNYWPSLPYLTFGVGRLLHLPSAETVSVRPNAQPQCNQKVTAIGCGAEQITSHLGLVTCSMVVPIRQSALG